MIGLKALKLVIEKVSQIQHALLFPLFYILYYQVCNEWKLSHPRITFVFP